MHSNNKQPPNVFTVLTFEPAATPAIELQLGGSHTSTDGGVWAEELSDEDFIVAPVNYGKWLLRPEGITDAEFEKIIREFWTQINP